MQDLIRNLTYLKNFKEEYDKKIIYLNIIESEEENWGKICIRKSKKKRRKFTENKPALETLHKSFFLVQYQSSVIVKAR